MLEPSAQEWAQYEKLICNLESRLRDNLLRRERLIKRINQETLAEIEKLIDYLRLVAVDADNLTKIRDILKQKVDNKRLDFERTKDSEADVRSRYSTLNNWLLKLKQDITDLKASNEILEQHKSVCDSPLMLKLFKTRHN